MADKAGIETFAAFVKDRGLYGAGPAIAYPEVPGGSDLAANDLIPFSQETLSKNIVHAEDASLLGAGQSKPTAIAEVNCNGAIGGPLTWVSWERMILCAMGFEHPCPTNGSPKLAAGMGCYGHIFEMDDTLQDEGWLAGEIGTYVPASANDRKVRRGKVGIAKVNDHVFGSSFINKMTIKGNTKKVDIQFDLISYDLYGGAYNSAAWTRRTGSDAIALFAQLTVKLGLRAAGVGGLSAGEAISSFELVVNNNMTSGDITAVSAPNIITPIRAGKREVTLKLEYPRYDAGADTWRGLADLNSEFAASVELVGPAISGGGTYEFAAFMSSLYCTNAGDGNISDPGALSNVLEFKAYKPVTTDIFAATEYLAVTMVKDSELVLKVQNLENVNYLKEI